MWVFFVKLHINIYILGHLSDVFCPECLAVIHTYIHRPMAVAAMQGADQHISSSLGFSILPKDT